MPAVGGVGANCVRPQAVTDRPYMRTVGDAGPYTPSQSPNGDSSPIGRARKCSKRADTMSAPGYDRMNLLAMSINANNSSNETE